jgi:hypothetical protein
MKKASELRVRHTDSIILVLCRCPCNEWVEFRNVKWLIYFPILFDGWYPISKGRKWKLVGGP